MAVKNSAKQSWRKRMHDLRERIWPEPARKLEADAGQYWTLADEKRRDLSHWVGHGRWADNERWLAVGRKHFAMYEKLLVLADADAHSGAMLEWGPGGGANAVQFANTFATYYGVDISEPNLGECGRQLEARGYAGFRPVPTDASHPEGVLAAVSEPIDFFLSTAVYQPFPSRRYGEQVTEIASRLLAPGGLALIQIRYENSNEKYRSRFRDYMTNAVTFTAYELSHFWQLLLNASLEPLAVTLEPRNNYAYFFIRKGLQT